MSDDLTARLRDQASFLGADRVGRLLTEAADEIQALREEAGGWEVASEMWQRQAEEYQALLIRDKHS